MDTLNATLNATLENGTNGTNGTTTPESPEGLMVAYTGLFLMALGPIYFGSVNSVQSILKKRESGEEVETITGHDAAMFPFIASGALFGIYLFFKFFSKEYINMLLSGYFFILGVIALAKLFSPFMHTLIPACFPNSCYNFHVVMEPGVSSEEDPKENAPTTEMVKFRYDRKDLVGLALSGAVGLWYILTKHWVANNMFGLAFSYNAVELLQLNKIGTGCILLGGLFIYDIFWVFGTDVMVTVAKSFEAPIKLVFPRDLLTEGIFAKNFAMLGLGDIVIPGIFIALLLRFDHSLKKGTRTYFITGFLAYIVGLLTTIVVMHVFKHAQPALLYLVPACLGAPILVALIKGEVKAMFSYEDSPELVKDDKSKDEKPTKENKKVK